MLAIVDCEVVAVSEVSEPGVEEIDVVDLQVHLDEGFPVDVVVVDANRIEHVAAEVPVRGGGDLCQVQARIARAGKQQSLPVGERSRAQLHARALREMRRAE